MREHRWPILRLILTALVLIVSPLIATGASAATAPRILALGDSLTAGYGLPPDDAFPVVLQQKLASEGIAASIVNGGVSGDTSAGGLARLDWALADKPDIVLVELGANDMLRGVDPAVTRRNLDQILDRIGASGAKILLIGIKAPTNWGPDYQSAFDAIYPELAAQHHVELYPFFLDGVALDPELNQADGLHPNRRGVDIIVERIAPYVARLIGGSKSGALESPQRLALVSPQRHRGTEEEGLRFALTSFSPLPSWERVAEAWRDIVEPSRSWVRGTRLLPQARFVWRLAGSGSPLTQLRVSLGCASPTLRIPLPQGERDEVRQA